MKNKEKTSILEFHTVCWGEISPEHGRSQFETLFNSQANPDMSLGPQNQETCPQL